MKPEADLRRTVISEVRARTCRVPLSRPIVMGEIRYSYREYVIVEIETHDGLCGFGYGMTRNSPVASIVNRTLRPMLIGENAALTERLWQRMYYHNLPMGQRGIFMRALSAVDIALWDLKGKATGLPVWQLLGGYRREIPAMVAGGYPVAGAASEQLADELKDYAASGYRAIKIAGGTLDEDTDRLEVARSAVPAAKLVYDAHWGWHSVGEVLPIVRDWTRFNLWWLEDPFPPEMAELNGRLRAATGIPLGLGEDGTGRWAFAEILRAGNADFLRIDATVMGGISEAARVCALASVSGVLVSPHIFAETHIHLAAAYPNVLVVEVTEPQYEVDLMYRLLAQRLEPVNGTLTAPERPGLGVDLDPAGMAEYDIGAAHGDP